MARKLLAAYSLVAFFLTWVAMCFLQGLLRQFPPGTSMDVRIQTVIAFSLRGEVLIGATALCTLNALSQFGFRHAIRGIIEECEPNPRGGFRWVPALQSVLIAWAIWYVTLFCHIAMFPV